MPKQDSPLGQLPDTIPEDLDTPDVNGDMAVFLAAIEKRLLMKFADRAERNAMFDTASVTPEDGMETYISSVHEIDKRINGVWVKIWPWKYSGTNVPSNAIGSVDDIYIQYAP